VQSNRENQAEALLNHVNRYQAGRLTVFLGAAPGVGKTYAMLARAKELFQQGTDVVVGIVETHGRIETLKILEGLPQISRKEMQYQGHTLEEMDLLFYLGIRKSFWLMNWLIATSQIVVMNDGGKMLMSC